MLEQKDLSEAIANTSGHVEEQSSGFGDDLLSLASLCRLSSGKTQQELDLVAKTYQKVLLDRNAHTGGEVKLMPILAGCAAIRDLPGIASFAQILPRMLGPLTFTVLNMSNSLQLQKQMVQIATSLLLLFLE